MEEIKQLSILPSISEDPSIVGLLKIKEQVSIATTTVHRQQYSLKALHRINLSYSVYSNSVIAGGIKTVSLFSGLSYP